jgi:hypothetical protein
VINQDTPSTTLNYSSPGTAVGARLGNKPGKIRDLLAGVRRDHLLGLLWFDVGEHGGPAHQDWHLEDNPAALAAFKADVAS